MRGRAMSERDLKRAVVQEMGGPAQDPDEMTTLGFWLGNVGFSFDSRGPSIEMLECSGHEAPNRIRKRRIGPAAVLSAARRLLGISSGADWGASDSDGAEGGVQLSLL